jgi:peptidoglycan/LPS O-acetylase OafA/YrhL
MQIRKFRPDIEALRAIAIILVVISHSKLGLSGGFIGVDIFFVISGFLISKHLYDEVRENGSVSLNSFYGRRILRILPASIAVIILTLMLAIVGLSSLQVINYGWDAFFSSFSMMNFRLASSGTDYFSSTSLPSPFQHFWSLAVEEQFYLIWPLMFLIFCKVFIKDKNFANSKLEPNNIRSFNKFKTTINFFLLAVIIVSLYLSYTITTSSQSWAYFGLHTRAWQLAVGCLIGINYQPLSILHGFKASWLSWLGFGGIILSLIIIDEKTVYPGLWSLIPTISTALIIVSGFNKSKYSFESVFAKKISLWIGKISYSWYLVHWPIFVLMFYNGYDGFHLGQKFGVILITFLLANISFLILENQVRFSSFFRDNLKATYTLGLSLVVIGALMSFSIQTFKDFLVSNPSTLRVNSSEIADYDLIQSIEIGLKTKQAPTSVTIPLIGKEIDEESKIEKCFESQNDLSLCTFGNAKSTKSIVMLGDNQIKNWLPAINKIGTVNSYKIVVLNNNLCNNTSDDAKATECQNWKNASINTIKLLNPEVIILADSINEVAIPKDKNKNYIDELKIIAKKVIRILPITTPTQDIPNCIKTNQDLISKCNFNYNNFGSNLKQTNDDKSQEIATIDPNDLICLKESCPATIDDIVVYNKKGNVSNDYSNYISEYLSPKIINSTDITPQTLKNALKQNLLSQSLKTPLEKSANDYFSQCKDDWLILKPSKENKCTIGSENASKTIALIGDSHAQQWIKTLEPFANKYDYKIITFIKSACSFTDIEIFEESFLKREYPECSQWRKEAIDQVTKLKPNAIILSEQIHSNSEPQKYEDLLSRLTKITPNVIKIMDTPRATTFVPECLAKFEKETTKCNYKKYEGIFNPAQLEKEIDIHKKLNLPYISTIDWFCYIEDCPVVIDNIIVFKDANHITTTFAKYLIDPMEKKLIENFPALVQ